MLAALVLSAVILATYLAVRPDSESEVETAVPETTVAPSDVGGDDAVEPAPSDGGGSDPVTPTPIVPPRPLGGDTTDEVSALNGGFAHDSDFGGGIGTVVHGPQGFARLSWERAGLVAQVSADGVEWSEASVTGLPERSNVRVLTRTDSQYVAVVEQYPEYDEDSEPFFFDDYEAPAHFLATSTDMTNWSVSPLPTIEPVTESEYGTSVGLVDAAVGDSGLVAVFSLYPQGPNELRLLFDAGIIGEDDFDTYCGLSWESFDAGEAVSVYSCDYEQFEEEMIELEERAASAESGEEIEAIETEFERFAPEQTEIATIEAGTDLWLELETIFTGPLRADVATVVLAGPLGGPYETRQLEEASGPSSGPSSIVATDDGFIVLFTEFGEFEGPGPGETSSRIIRSSDGLSWSGPDTITTAGGVWDMEASGSLVVATGGDDEGQPLTLVSTDSGTTWTRSDLGRDLYGAWVVARGGPAGMALGIEGATEPYPTFPMPTLRAVSDGYVVELRFEEDVMFLYGPDGEVIHEVPELGSALGSPEVPGVLREDPGDAITFLDPETGEDLVTFTEEDVEEQFAEATSDIDEMPIEEPPRERQLWFSTDGLSWTELDAPDVDLEGNSYSELAAVGDDEVLVSVTTWIEPPQELFAFEMEEREPTEAEMDALDEWFAENEGGSRVEWIRIPVS